MLLFGFTGGGVRLTPHDNCSVVYANMTHVEYQTRFGGEMVVDMRQRHYRERGREEMLREYTSRTEKIMLSIFRGWLERNQCL